jgi:hypothetical protein
MGIFSPFEFAQETTDNGKSNGKDNDKYRDPSLRSG